MKQQEEDVTMALGLVTGGAVWDLCGGFDRLMHALRDKVREALGCMGWGHGPGGRAGSEDCGRMDSRVSSMYAA